GRSRSGNFNFSAESDLAGAARFYLATLSAAHTRARRPATPREWLCARAVHAQHESFHSSTVDRRTLLFFRGAARKALPATGLALCDGVHALLFRKWPRLLFSAGIPDAFRWGHHS